VTTAWLVLALDPDDRDHAGNEGYDDEPSRTYLYDSKVQNSRQVAVGDLAVVRDKTQLLGIATIVRIDEQAGAKVLLRCPACQKTRLRKRAAGDFRCASCGEVTTSPIADSVDVTKYAAHFGESFVAARGLATVQELTAACPGYTQQLSMQRIDLSLLPRLAARARSLIESVAVPRDASVRGVVRAERDHSSRAGLPGRPDARPIGTSYRNIPAPSGATRRDPFEVDPDKVDRGNRAHTDTQNALADFLRESGIEPLAALNGDAEFDLAWEVGDVIYVAEVKSITTANEEKQLRLGLGQVLRYQHHLRAGGRHVIAVLVPERQPSDMSWEQTCAGLGVVLTWPGCFERLTGN
jgi:hypothetical protein